MSAQRWLPRQWAVPVRARIRTGQHLRPLRVSDLDRGMAAVLGSRERLWSIYGSSCAWPAEELTVEDALAQLRRVEADADEGRAFTYALLDSGERELLGCVHVCAPRKQGADAEVDHWVVDWLVGGPIERALDEFLDEWLTSDWPFTTARVIGRSVSRAEWRAMPDATPVAVCSG